MTETKRQVLPQGLWVVATPIGNLADFTPRARQAIEECDVLLCEDTRQAAKLVTALGIDKPMSRMERVDAHTPDGKLERLVERLGAGESFALISDAGTPAISDPGAALVARAWDAGVRVTPVPGVSAVAALFSVSGFESGAFTFRGFFPRKKGEIDAELDLIGGSRASRSYAWYESPQRVVEALAFVADRFESARMVAAKELTKLHERVFVGTAREVASQVAREIESEGERGEWCFAIELPVQDESSEASEASESSDWVKALHCLLDAQVSASEAARQVSRHYERPKKIVYETALKIFGKKSSEGG